VGDSEWLAQLARFGPLRGSFIPPKDSRELRIVSRYRRELTGMRTASTTTSQSARFSILVVGAMRFSAASRASGSSFADQTLEALLDRARAPVEGRLGDVQQPHRIACDGEGLRDPSPIVPARTTPTVFTPSIIALLPFRRLLKSIRGSAESVTGRRVIVTRGRDASCT
jgi:hypothetical protein